MDLARRLSSDLDGAFMDLVATHGDLVYSVALRVVGRAAEAEDVAQESFVRAYRALERYPAQRIATLKLRPWLAKIALNLARNSIRARRSEDELDGEVQAGAATGNEPVQLAERREERRFWMSLLEGLPPRYALAVALRHVDGLSYAELAETLDRPLGSVKSDVHRGVRLLRVAYEEAQARAGQREAV